MSRVCHFLLNIVHALLCTFLICAERLCAAIEAIDTPLMLGERVTVTASIGVATVTGGSDAPSEVLRRADQALYRAKNGGRNQVCMGEP